MKIVFWTSFALLIGVLSFIALDSGIETAAGPLIGTPILIALVVGGIAIYCLPFCVAHYRHHRNENAIGILNIFLGWTFIGWVAALVWSATDNVYES